MPYDEDTKVFDVARPSKAQPDSTSRPVIVGHRPQMSDPMVKEESKLPMPSASGTPIRVAMADEEPHDVLAHPAEPTSPSIEPETPKDFASHYEEAKEHEHHEEASHPEHQGYEQPSHEPAMPNAPMPEQKEEISEENTEASNFTSLNSLIPEAGEDPESHEESAGDMHHPHHDSDWNEAPPLPVTKGAGPKRRWPKVLGALLLLALIAAVTGFIAIDDGLVQSNVKLPFHIFNKQKFPGVAATNSPAPAAVNNPAPSPSSSVPSGFTAYKLTGTNVSFAYPTAWGAPTATSDSGFSKRGGSNKSDGTYAYLLNFATNKDVQLAFTSSKYLPTTRGTLYYDFLQWCTGTNDGKFYKQLMRFTSANGTDTPGTIACDQGPLADATKVDNVTIVQLNTKDQGSKPIGDLYTENLTDSDLTVLHVKDASMKNSVDIKQLLTTVKSSSSPTP
jgi:hypothetical protein